MPRRVFKDEGSNPRNERALIPCEKDVNGWRMSLRPSKGETPYIYDMYKESHKGTNVNTSRKPIY